MRLRALMSNYLKMLYVTDFSCIHILRELFLVFCPLPCCSLCAASHVLVIEMPNNFNLITDKNHTQNSLTVPPLTKTTEILNNNSHMELIHKFTRSPIKLQTKSTLMDFHRITTLNMVIFLDSYLIFL